ncbi:probable ribosome-binding factor A, chloroplastic [Actinidia eriantha]|uniref:probable ribosome-binding factor A, chloroplastic n=1 Tax=Actinidia eriantha TaxID=165200 RepID=UPI0025879F7A|nr:probable ribosome-binding factor A, chloroplastic [Actinidia eriantha]
MPHLLLSQPHLRQTPFTAHHHRPQQPPPPSTTATLFRRCSLASKPSPAAVVLRPPLPQRMTIRCMARPRRVKMVAKQIMRELSQMLLTDKVLQYAVLPEAALGADRYLSSLTTISDVEISADLQVVRVYVSVFGDERGKEVAIAGLKSKAKYVRSELGRRMKLRLTPEIHFIEDDSIERGSRVIAILDKIKKEKMIDEGESDDQDELSDQPQDDSDWEEDDPDDEGIIYVK